MPRPRKCRRVCHMPRTREFLPTGGAHSPVVTLAVEEYETLRLIDKEGYSQEECSQYMQIARTSVQHIYAAARHKLALALVDGLPIRIEGGNYRLCDGSARCHSCPKRNHVCERKDSQ